MRMVLTKKSIAYQNQLSQLLLGSTDTTRYDRLSN